jgi:hypothetical protein
LLYRRRLAGAVDGYVDAAAPGQPPDLGNRVAGLLVIDGNGAQLGGHFQPVPAPDHEAAGGARGQCQLQAQ